MRRRALKRWFNSRRDGVSFLLLHEHGEYEYRNPDSVYIHRFETFKSREDAERYLAKNIAAVDRPEWTLFERVEPASVGPTDE